MVKWSQKLYCASFGILCLRSVHFLMINATLGPQIQMIKAMLTDLRLFMVLMGVFIISEGIILQSFKNPNSTPPNGGHDLLKLIYDIVFIPYFQIYGELFVEDFSNEEKVIITSIEEYNAADCEQNQCCLAGRLDQMEDGFSGSQLEPCYQSEKVGKILKDYC